MSKASRRRLAAVSITVVVLTTAAAPGMASTGAAAMVRTTAGTGTVREVSVNSSGKPANDWSYGSGLSAHGRFVVFGSDGSNLVARDTNRATDVFVRDRFTGLTTRQSISSRGAQANGPSMAGPLSADGRVVTFTSEASNLVTGDTNRVQDVFARDRIKGVTSRVSVGPRGRQANAASEAPVVSADGRYVAFHSDATNLVPGDTNRRFDVFVRDRARGVTERVSVATSGKQGNGDSAGPSISADGRYVAFSSSASNLVPGDTNRVEDVFVRDRVRRVTLRVSLTSTGHQLRGVASGVASISGNGRYVAFELTSNAEGIGIGRILVRDTVAGVTREVSTPARRDLLQPSISADGRYIAYIYAPGDRLQELYLWDQRNKTARRLPSYGNNIFPLLSADGHHAAFTVEFITGPDYAHAYVWDAVTDAPAKGTSNSRQPT